MNSPLRSLAGRITLLVLLATVTSSLTVSWISMQSLDGFLREKIDQRFPHIATRIAGELDHWYDLRQREISVFAESSILTESAARLRDHGARGDRARGEAEQYLQYVLEAFPHFERIVLTTPSDEPVLEVGPSGVLPEGFWRDPARSTEHARISEPVLVDGRHLQVASVPLRSPSGQIAARLNALIDVDMLDRVLRSDELGESATIYLVDRDLHFLNPPPGVAADARYNGEGAASDLTSPVAYYDDPSGLRVVGTRLAFHRYDWMLVIEQPYDDAFAPIVSSMSRVAALNIAIILAVGLAAFRIAGSIVKPLRALSNAAERLSHGERGVEIDEARKSSEEVAVLTRTFNEMSRGLARNARELEDNQHAIESANTELIEKNETLSNMNLVLEQLSITDGLTKLHNHRYFQEALGAECKRSARTAEPLCLILIDIDYFKKWNDRLGHAGGDEILRRIAEILNESVRATDLLARYGGEEFALLAIDTDLSGATALAEKIRGAVESTSFMTDVPSEREPITVSVGVALFRGDHKALFSEADAALYSAKDGGRNRVEVAATSSGGPTTDPESLRQS